MRVRSRTALVLLALLPSLAAAPWLGAQEVSLEPLLNGLVDPVAITHAGDERLFVTLQPGQVVIWDGSKLLARPFLDIRDRVGTGGERGLLSVAFHPDYLRNGFFFVKNRVEHSRRFHHKSRILEQRHLRHIVPRLEGFAVRLLGSILRFRRF